MTSEVQICNMALGHVRADNRVQTVFPFPEDSEEARQCFIFYETARDAVLEAHQWSFAAREATLALTANTPPTRWTYEYAFPADCIKPRAIAPTGHTAEPIPFETAIDSDLGQRLIWTDEAAASLIYTARVEDPNVYTPGFVTAFARRLGAELAIPLKGDAKIQDAQLNAFNALISMVATSDANTGQSYRRSTPRGSTATRARR